MKKSLCLLMLLASFAGFSQAISVNTTTYNANQLVNDVLISSPCTSGTNITTKTGVDFGSVNGIGYFENTSSNPNFPFAKGVVLSTGDVTKIPGVNPATPNTTTLSDGSMAWTGDTDLQNILQTQSGITFNSINATYLQFNFTPVSSNFSFDFVFASEEYGLLQCNFSDAFAFILTDLTTGVTKNLAVVNGNAPISVATIRNSLYNQNCPSVNANFFGAYNGSGFGPAINFNGQTVKMTASAVVDVTHQYRIKLVIADGVDANNIPSPLYDSAVFLGANTFNIGTEILGLDYTAVNATATPPRDAICPGSPLPVLQPVTAPPTGTTYQWLQNGTPLSGQTGPSLNLQALGGITATTTFTLQYTRPGCDLISDDITVEIYPALNAPQPNDLFKSCESAAPTHSFDLGLNTTLMMASLPAGTIITYHASQNDANSGNAPLSVPYTLTHAQAVAGVTVYARIKSATSPCFETKSFLVKYVNDPVVTIPPVNAANTKCATNYPVLPPRAIFNLSSQDANVLGPLTPANAYVVKYYTSYANAQAGGTAGFVATPGNFNSASRDLFARIEVVGSPSCFAVSPTNTPTMSIVVTPKAHVDDWDDVLICSTSTGYQLPALTDATAGYFPQTNGGGNQLDTPAETLVNTTKTIYIYNNPGGSQCSNESSFKVTKANLTTLTAGIPTTPVCTKYTLPTLDYGVFVANNAAPGPGNPVITGDITTTTTLYVWVDSIGLTPPCSESKPVTINIIPFVPVVQASYPNQFACTSFTLGTNMPSNAQVTYWTGPNQTGTQKFIGDVITANTTIYLHQSSGSCTNDDVSFTIYIGNNNITMPPNQTRCTYQLPNLTVGEYHTASFANGGGTQLFPGQQLTQAGPNTIWVYVPGQPCTYNNSFTITLQLSPIDPIADVPAQCDYYVLPANTHPGNYYEGIYPNGTLVADNSNSQNYVVTGEGVHNFYLSQVFGSCHVEEAFSVTIVNTPVIDSYPDATAACNTSTYTLPPLTHPSAYYNSPGGVGPISGNTITQATSGVRTVYIYQQSATPGVCPAESSFDVTFSIVNVNPVNDIYTCDTNFSLPAINGPGDYYTAQFGPAGSGTKITLPYTVTNNTGTTQSTQFWVYADDGNPVPCRAETSFMVTQYVQPVVQAPAAVHTCGSYTLPAYSSFATTPANAINHYYTGPGGTGTELFPNDVITTAQTIYIYAGITSPSNTVACYTEQQLVLDITPYPVIAPALSNMSGCDQVTLPALTVGTYYSDAAYTNQITNLTLTSSQTVYVKAVSATNNCETTGSFTVTVTPSPQLAIANPTLEACDSYTLPAYNDAMFSTPAGAVDHYFLASGTEVFPGNTITTSQVITVEAHNGTCSDSATLTINISATPVLAPVSNLSGCDHVQLPGLAVGNYYSDATHTNQITNTDLTTSQTVYVYAENPANTNCNASASFSVTVTNTPVLDPADVADVNACNTYTLPALNTPGAAYYTGPNGTGAQIPAGTVYNTNGSTTIHVYAANGTCTASEDKVINIFRVEQLPNYNGCAPYSLPALTVAGSNYYTGPNGTGTLLNAGNQITTTQTIYVYGTGPSGCSSETSFTVTKLADAVANDVTDPALTTVCDSDSNPDDFVTAYDLDRFTATVLGSQSPADFTVKYYPSSIDADLQTNELATDGTPAADTAINPVFARIQNATGCHDEVEILTNVVPQPHIDSDLSGVVCTDPDTGEVTPAYIESGYPGGTGPGSYRFEWKDSTGTVVATTPNLQTTIPGEYTLVISANGVNTCESAAILVHIIESARPASVDVVTTGWFTDRQTIKVIATPYIGTSTANFLYSLDGQTPQTQNEFTDVFAGIHEIVVSDANGCGATPVPFSVELVSSPAYFTPNGDGVNDVWRINGVNNIPAGSIADVSIYDRFGKLIKQFTSQNDGWDGSLNGQPLPATDYWFSVKYIDSTGKPKEFKSHFSLVR